MLHLRPITLLLLFPLLLLSLALDPSNYKLHVRTRVTPPYRSALSVISTDIIEYLATTPIPVNSTQARVIAQHLDTRARLFSTHLAESSTAAESLRQQLDTRVLQLVSDGSKAEGQIRQNQEQLQRVQSEIGQTQAQLREAHDQVRRAEESAKHAERQVIEEEHRVERARHCRGKRFIKKVFREVTRVIDDVVVKPVCQVANVFTGHIDRAKSARSAAYDRLAQTRRRSELLRAQSIALQQRQIILIITKTSLDVSRLTLRNQLTTTNGERDRVSAINLGLKSLMAHIGSLLGKSQVLKDVVLRLIDMETVISPIQALGDQIVGYTGDQEDSKMIAEVKRKIRENLPLVKRKLPQYALILD